MKKTTVLIAFILGAAISGFSQVLNQNANWPNNEWSITGDYLTNPNVFEADPRISTNFAYDDDDAGNGHQDNIAAESPTVNLTNAHTAGENWIFVTAPYVFNNYINELLKVQYWDADASQWIDWGNALNESTAPPTNNYCTGATATFNSQELDIASFSANQLANFRYRIFYDDNGHWGYGFCFSSPTLFSQTPPACPNVSGIYVSNISTQTASIYWTPGSSETSWQVAIQTSGSGTPTSGTDTSDNNPYHADGLVHTTNYEVYVRSVCGGDYGNWIGPVYFTTLSPARVNFIQETMPISGYDLTVVDMNGDFLDDIVSVTSNNVTIRYQLPSGGFNTVNIPTPTADFLPGWSIAAADFDRNGYTDLLYGSGSGVTFMKANSTGTGFTEISGPEYVFSQRSNFVDINNDGHLDAFVCHDVQPNVYYINDGYGNLIYNQGGLGDYYSGGNYGSIWVDYDNDRDIDMFIAKCGGEVARRTNQMLTNNGDGTYTENAAVIGLADPMETWSSAWGDFDNDGDMDVFVGASSGTHKLMRNNGDGTFTDYTAASGVLAVTTLGHENVTYDLDNDGNLDIICNGVILYGNGDLTFTQIDNTQLNYANGAFGDLNNDGYIDAYYNGRIYWNGTTSNNWIKVHTVGTVSNINGIGARVELHTDNGIQIRDVRSGEGFKFMSSLNTHFGIGTETTINNITIYWPSGLVDVVEYPTINTAITVVEGTTLSFEDTIADDLVVYPNPVHSVLNIKSREQLSNVVYTIFDTNGKRVMNGKLNNQSLDVSELMSGQYFLRLMSGNNIKTQKFIKQ